ncbi:MAG: thioredoxin family protein [Opitutaceae bacterium]|nr:thioredoxin family protein [Opitutaceae bacterium]
MKSILRISFVSFLLLAFAGLARAGGEGWTTDYQAALAKAKAENKLVLLDFTGSDWCGWCKRLDKEVFSQQEFKDFTQDRFVLVELDFPRKKKLDEATQKQNFELQDQFKIEGYPTIIIVDGDGKEIERLGYEEGGAANYNKVLEGVIAKSKKS